MDQFYNLKSLYLWPILLVLLVLVYFVGGKAIPDPGLLVEGGKYNRPLRALEQEPTAKEQLFKSWDEETRKKLRSALYWDFLFILIYPTSSVLACFLAGRFLDSAGILSFRISLVIILLQLAAGLFDVIENLIMLRVIDGLTANLWLTIARISTMGKFGLIALGMLHAIFGLLAWLYLKLFSSTA
ncbi:MAG TPA: hypothetical protein VN843_12500 [Anaerolineales bacterium]|nr:hypothetical protein [Anaerolineales bacterium]